MKHIKHVLWVTGGLTALALGIAFYLMAHFDPLAYKERLIQQFQTRQRLLQIEGDIGYSLLPKPSLTVEHATLSEHDSPQRFVSVDKARMSLQWLPLLTGKVVVDKIEAQGLSLELMRYRSGSYNTEDLLQWRAEAFAPGQSDLMLLRFDAPALKLAGATIHFRDEIARSDYTLSNLMLESGRILTAKAVPIELHTKMVEKRSKLEAELHCKSTLTVSRDKNAYRMRNLLLDAQGGVGDINHAKVSASGELSLNLETHDFTARKFQLNGNGMRGAARFEIRVAAPELKLTQDKVSADGVVLNGRLEGDAGSMAAALSLPAMKGNAQSFKVSSMLLEIDTRRPGRDVNIKLTAPATGSLNLRQINLQNLKLTLGANTEILPGNKGTGELTGSAQADFGRQNIEANLKGVVFQNELNLKASLRNFTVPNLRFDLELEEFDLSPYLERLKQLVSAPVAEHGEKKRMRVDGSVRIGTLRLPDLQMGHLRMDMKLRDEKLDIAPFTASVYQGEVEARLTVQTNDHRYAAKGRLRKVELEPLLHDTSLPQLLRGKADVMFDLNAQGDDLAGIRNALDGTVSLRMHDGEITGIDLSQAESMESGKLDRQHATSFTAGRASFKVTKGIARNTDLSLKAATWRSKGSGMIDVGRQQIDYRLITTYMNRNSRFVGLKGPFTDIRYETVRSGRQSAPAQQKPAQRQTGKSGSLHSR